VLIVNSSENSVGCKMATNVGVVLVLLCFMTVDAADQEVQQDENDLSKYDVDIQVLKPQGHVQAFGMTRCTNMPHGFDRMRRGVDATKLDLLPLDMKVDFGYRHPIFDFTCDEGKKIRLGENVFDLPDQFLGSEPVPGGLKEVKTEVFRSIEQVTRSMKLKVGVGDALGLFSLSASVEHAHSTLTNRSRNIEEVSAFVSAFRADLVPAWSLQFNSHVQSFVAKMLTKPFEESPEVYYKFIKYFGTHYFKDASFGGLLKLYVETEKKYFEETTSTKVGLEASALFGAVVRVKGGPEIGHSVASSNFKHSSRQTFRYFGGETNLLDKSDMKSWVPTVISNPWLFRGSLMPIQDILTDEEKKKQLAIATQVYLDKAYLQRMRKQIQSVVKDLGSSKTQTDQLFDTVDRLLGEVAPKHEDVVAIGKAIEYHLIIPDWFKENVYLCFSWDEFRQRSKTKCGTEQDDLPRSRQFCSRINQLTSKFMDIAKKEASCYYMWSIQVRGKPDQIIPDYFKNTELCHQYEPSSGADSDQCNAMIDNGLQCAKVNDRTPPYRDATYMDDWGCKNTWMVKTPEDAPMWLKRLYFCIVFRGRGPNAWEKMMGKKKTPCGNTWYEPRDSEGWTSLCSFANKWTKAFSDFGHDDREDCYWRYGLFHTRID